MNTEKIFQSPIFLAPMAGVTDSAFRIITRELIENSFDKKNLIFFSEMVSAAGIHFKNEKTLEMLKIFEDEKPLAIQIFGSDPKICAEAAEFIEKFSSPAAIDFNLGCPAPKIVKNGEGSALMKNPKLTEKILSAVRKKISLPFSVKIRLGFDENNLNALEIAKIAENSGVNFITIHGRTRNQFYSGKANWEEIAKIKSEIKIPVIANGDVKNFDLLEKIFSVTKADGVMIGRAAQGNPWIIGNFLKFFRTGEKNLPPTLSERKKIMLRHFEKLLEIKGEFVAVREMRSHAAWYTKGLRGGAELRKFFNCANTAEDFRKIISEKILQTI